MKIPLVAAKKWRYQGLFDAIIYDLGCCNQEELHHNYDYVCFQKFRKRCGLRIMNIRLPIIFWCFKQQTILEAAMNAGLPKSGNKRIIEAGVSAH